MKRILFGALAALMLSTPVQAAPVRAAEDTNFKAGDFLVRVRAIGVLPHEKSSTNIGTTIEVDNAVVPEVDFTYFFTKNISAELIAAVTPHDVKTATGVDAGSSWLLPPTLTLQYHFDQLECMKPYVGAGINYTHFFNEDAGALNSVEYDDSVGLALQAGVDVPLQDNWYANIDVKKVWINTTAEFSPSGVRADVDINPWIVGVGVGYRF